MNAGWKHTRPTRSSLIILPLSYSHFALAYLHNIAHWVGSHPSLVPCDLTEDVFDDWTWNDRKESDFSWGMIPRPTQISHQHNKLLGNLFKWYHLYNEAPDNDSWAWRSFPDGAQWKAAVAKFGNRTVEVTLETERKKRMSLATNNTTVASRRKRRRR
jgi:hypothetical protein